jgi:hypothetical protein
MLGTEFSRLPWIFNVGEMLTGFAAIVGALGLYRVFRKKNRFLFTGLVGFAIA